MKSRDQALAPLLGAVLAILAGIPAPAAGQGIIVPPCVDVPEAIVLTPDGSIPFTARFTDGRTACSTPIVGALAKVRFSPEADALIAWAPGQTHPDLIASTDDDGRVTFHIAGAGCLDPGRFQDSYYVAQITLDDVVVAEIQVVTAPDVVNGNGLLASQLGTTICDDGVTTVGLSDAVFHTNAIKNGLVEPCSKLTGNPADPVNLDDAVALTPFIKAGDSFVCK